MHGGNPPSLTSNASMNHSAPHLPPLRFAALLPLAIAIILAGCATTEAPRGPAMTAAEARALAARLLPESVGARNAWAPDIHAAMVVLEVPVTPENICAVVAITDQESNFRVDPPVPGPPGIAWKEIDARRERAGIPEFMLDAALSLESPTGRTHRQRIDAVKTEQQLSRIFEDFIGMVPMGKTFFADRNPVRTGGPMQVSIEFRAALPPAPTRPTTHRAAPPSSRSSSCPPAATTCSPRCHRPMSAP